MAWAKSVLGIVPGLQATALVAHNIPNLDFKRRKDFGIKPIVRRGVGTLVGISLMRPTAQMINVFP